MNNFFLKSFVKKTAGICKDLTLDDQAEMFPDSSTAGHLIVVSPGGKKDPDSGTQISLISPEQLSFTIGGEKWATAPFFPGSLYFPLLEKALSGDWTNTPSPDSNKLQHYLNQSFRSQ